MPNATDFYSEAAYNEALFEEQGIPYSNDSQAAFAASMRESNIVREDKKLTSLLAEGKSVIIESFVHYCPRTDAILGSSMLVKSVFDTAEAAEIAYEALKPEEACCDDYCIGLRVPRDVGGTPITPEALDDDCPF